MGIEAELMEFLEASTEGARNSARDKEIIAHFYGFRGDAWPTLEETAKAFAENPEEQLSRERIRQIINKRFRNSRVSKTMPSAHTLVRLIRSRTIWRRSDLRDAIVNEGLCQTDFSIRGILNLIEQMNLGVAYEIFTSQLKEMSRWETTDKHDGWVIEKGSIKALRNLMSKAFKLPGRCGIAKLAYLDDPTLTPELYEVIYHSITTQPDAWIHRDGDDLWFLLENRENTLINDCERIFSVYSAVDAVTLSKALRRSLNGRTHHLPYPSETMILRYLREGRLFERQRDELHFLGSTRELNNIEASLVSLLKDSDYKLYPTLRKSLANQGFNSASITKAIHNSPVVHVDVSRGRSHYRYSLVGQLITDVQPVAPATATTQTNVEVDDNDERYARYRRRLSQFADQATDSDADTTARKEHQILRAWLFAGKRYERCALCNNIFSVSSLVTAHKKRRADCNNEERIDPNIVMPLCQFGCDFLYERHFVVIKDGVIAKGHLLDPTEYEAQIIDKLVGLEISKRWLVGRQGYFHTASDDTPSTGAEDNLIAEEA